YRAASAVANALPGPVAGGLSQVASVPLSLAMRGRRRTLASHLQRVHGGRLSPVELELKLREAFHSYARYWLESFRLPGTDAEHLEAGMSWEGIGHIHDGLAAGRGVIIALPHLGGWDFGGAWLATTGIPITVVVEALDPPELFEWFAALRRSKGIDVVAHTKGAGTAGFAVLRRNEVLGLVCDRDLTRTGVEVEFFGERTLLPAGPAVMALRTGCALLPTAVYFTGRRHLGFVRPPLDAAPTGALRDDVARVTQDLAHEFEAMIRRAPEQWHMLQPNWPSDPGY
ncbi:MAG TPA: phosphatidylinositol mannoside acyltransferase, partial [Acidimicrobiales bacterium]|nr:phosphatidylinositol mannoside acyltransferase [Acidimicrobiales bacterium]